MNFEKINIFFCGSPSDGFQAYPDKYLNEINGYDASHIDGYQIVSKINTNNNYSQLVYIVYGIKGGRKNQIRGGRNFGVFVRIAGHTFDSKIYQKLYQFFDDFFNKAIVNNIIDKNNNELLYRVHNFQEKQAFFENLIEIFKNNFIKDFNEYLVEIDSSMLGYFDLKNVSNKPKTKYVRDNSQNEHSKLEFFNLQKTNGELLQKVGSQKQWIWGLGIVTTLFFMTLIGGVMYNFFHLNDETEKGQSIEQRTYAGLDLYKVKKKYYLNGKEIKKFIAKKDIKISSTDDIIKSIARGIVNNTENIRLDEEDLLIALRANKSELKLLKSRINLQKSQLEKDTFIIGETKNFEIPQLTILEEN